MELRNARIECYRRFVDETVRLNENLIAVIGPNEAGKSSFLEALEELNSEEPIDDYNATRERDCTPSISVTFVLQEHEQERFESMLGVSELTQWTLTKTQDGTITVDYRGDVTHDKEPRQEMLQLIEDVEELESVQNHGRSSKKKKRRQSIKTVKELLQSEEDYLGDTKIGKIEKLSDRLQDVADNSDEQESKIDTTVEQLIELAEHERQCPVHQVKQELKKSRPKFISFTEEDRKLRNRYNLDKHGSDPPSAVKSLAELADLNLTELVNDVKEGRQWNVRSLTDGANEKLEDYFSKSWVNEEVVPKLNIDNNILHIHVQTKDEDGYSPIEERSVGLQWFVALVAFLHTKGAEKNPILLVDEAEQHLSYDAQASLIEVLESQQLADTVIYTTHSAGCLPSDLGRGVRPILPKENTEESNIKNSFWREEQEGFSPLMMSMGLSSFSFTVARNALIGEGPCECLLLPSLIRQAVGVDELRYQVAPGASNIEPDAPEGLLSEAGQTAFIVDSDDGGMNLRENLIDAGADNEHLFTYSEEEPVILEDLVDPEILTEAVNEELETWQSEEYGSGGAEFDTSYLPEYGRIAAINEWCNNNGYDEIQKTTLSQRLADKAGGGTQIVDAEKEELLKKVDNQVVDYFDITRDSD